MQGRQKQVIEMYQRVQDFLGASPPPASAGYTIQKQRLDEIVAKLTDHSTDQLLGRRMSRSESQREEALRKQLREKHLAPLAKIARASVKDVPGIEPAMRLPAPNLSTLKLVTEANSLRAAAAKFAAVFVESGRPDDFLERLDIATETLRQSLMGKARNVGQHVGAKRGLANEIKRGRKAVDVIDTIVKAAFSDKPDVLGKWRVARRIRGGTGSPSVPTGGTADENLGPETPPVAA